MLKHLLVIGVLASCKSADVPPAIPGMTSTADFTRVGDALNAKIAAAAKEPDCGKLGAALAATFAANKADIDRVTAWEKAHPDDKTAFDHANKVAMEAAMVNVTKCSENPDVKAALAKMPAE